MTWLGFPPKYSIFKKKLDENILGTRERRYNLN
jgi:hypothetical protein